MRIRNRWLIGIFMLLVCYLLLQFYPYEEYSKSIQLNSSKHRGPLVIAHGGAKKLYPENTILAFEKSVEMGVDAIEMDIRLTMDEVLCTIHDDEISHYTNQKGKVQEYTYQELSLFNFAYQFKNLQGEYSYRNVNDDKLIPAKVELLFEQYRDSIYYILEIKESGERGKRSAKLLYDLIVKYKLEEKCFVASFEEDTMNYFQSINRANISCVMDYETSKDFVVANYLGYNRFQTYTMDGLMLPLQERGIELDDWYLIHKIHEQDLFVFYWTIDDVKTMNELVENKVDGIITDRPDLLLKLLDS
ncbi:MAG: glycerophosphodiester phosphodiesterase [Bacilli bacterium]|nr:glycerophosphodiester phosphodiesterase [Bacilli bacterium]